MKEFLFFFMNIYSKKTKIKKLFLIESFLFNILKKKKKLFYLKKKKKEFILKICLK
jgi:hypothetical protein